MALKCVLRAAGMKQIEGIVFTALNGELAVKAIQDEIA